MDFIELKSRCWQSWLLREARREDLFSCCPQLLEATPIPWLMAPSPNLTHASDSASGTSSLALLSSKYPCDYMEPMHLIQNALPHQTSSCDQTICSLKRSHSFYIGLFFLRYVLPVTSVFLMTLDTILCMLSHLLFLNCMRSQCVGPFLVILAFLSAGH